MYQVLGLGLAGLAIAVGPAAIARTVAVDRSMTTLDMPAPEATLFSTAVVGDAPQMAQSLPDAPFADVSPAHWAYPAVTSLVNRYACVSGYPDGTFQGDRIVSRYEFAAALSACLDTLVQLAAPNSDADLSQILADLAEMQAELGGLSNSVDTLEDSTAP